MHKAHLQYVGIEFIQDLSAVLRRKDPVVSNCFGTLHIFSKLNFYRETDYQSLKVLNGQGLEIFSSMICAFLVIRETRNFSICQNLITPIGL